MPAGQVHRAASGNDATLITSPAPARMCPDTVFQRDVYHAGRHGNRQRFFRTEEQASESDHRRRRCLGSGCELRRGFDMRASGLRASDCCGNSLVVTRTPYTSSSRIAPERSSGVSIPDAPAHSDFRRMRRYRFRCGDPRGFSRHPRSASRRERGRCICFSSTSSARKLRVLFTVTHARPT